MLFECPKIEDLNESNLNRRLQDKIDNKTKPQGSLGRIENLAHSIGLILGHDTTGSFCWRSWSS